MSPGFRSPPSPPVFELHSLPASPAEIPERFSSSLLPPSFAAGRCAAIFLPGVAATRGQPHPLTRPIPTRLARRAGA